MDQETPNCTDCGHPLFLIGGIGKNEVVSDDDKTAWLREKKLWQCDTCKWTKIA